MGYRILVEPEAAERLRSWSSYLVQRLGRQLAELADLASIVPPTTIVFARGGGKAELLRLEIEDTAVRYRVDDQEQTLTVVEVEPPAGEQPGARAG